jgi:ketosteroid isomerase-like protein
MRKILLASALALVACAPTTDPAAMRESVLEADRQFAIETTARGAEGWASFFAADGVQFPNSGRIDGREAITEFMSNAVEPGVASLLWEPTEAVVSQSGDLAYTLGRYQVVDGDSVIGTGNYVTVWTKEDGEWRVAVDIGNND